jgi:hypothetical protein
MTEAVVHATGVRLPFFTQGLHKSLHRAGVDCFRVPTYSDRATEITLELEATDERDCLARISRVLREHEQHFNWVTDVVCRPVAFPGLELQGDGPPE